MQWVYQIMTKGQSCSW